MRFFLVYSLAILTSAPGQAQRVEALQLRVDNDFFAMRFGRMPMDFDYTSGLELGLRFERAPDWVSGVVARASDESKLLVSFGQRIYTPRSRGVRDVPGQLPFAGWLYVAAAAQSETHRSIRALRVEVGVTGPPSLAQETQSSLHTLTGSERLSGWENQLSTEPGISVRYDLARRIYLIRQTDFGIEIQSGSAVGLGTIWSGAQIGVKLFTHRRAFSLFAGIQGEWVLRNEFLDGTVFRSSESTTKIPFIGQIDYGASLRFGQLGATVRFVMRSREYDGQPLSHLYGSLTASLYF